MGGTGSVAVSGVYSTVVAGIPVGRFIGCVHIAGIVVTAWLVANSVGVISGVLVARLVAMVVVVGHIAVMAIVMVAFRLVSDFVCAVPMAFVSKVHVIMGLLVIPSGANLVGCINPGGIGAEETVACIAVVDCEVQCALADDYRSVEVLGLEEKFILPAGKYITEFICTAIPIDSEDVSSTNQAIEVVQIDFIDSVVLVICEVQFVGHLIGEEKRFAACPFVAHSVSVHHCCENDRGNE